MSNESYLIVPHEIYTDSNLRHFDKLLFGKIYSLSRQKGYCWSSNSYFAKELNVSTRYVSNSINRLKELGIPTHFAIFNGCYHGFDIVAPGSKEAKEAKKFFMNALEKYL